jgi:hypothetical protein
MALDPIAMFGKKRLWQDCCSGLNIRPEKEIHLCRIESFFGPSVLRPTSGVGRMDETTKSGS